jgi:hypothetical protein
LFTIKWYVKTEAYYKLYFLVIIVLFLSFPSFCLWSKYRISLFFYLKMFGLINNKEQASSSQRAKRSCVSFD